MCILKQSFHRPSLYFYVHDGSHSHCWDGGVKNERDEEQEGEEAADGEGPQKQRGVVLDLLQPGHALLLVCLLRVGVHHDVWFILMDGELWVYNIFSFQDSWMLSCLPLTDQIDYHRQNAIQSSPSLWAQLNLETAQIIENHLTTSCLQHACNNKHCEILVSCSNWVDWIDLIELTACMW